MSKTTATVYVKIEIPVEGRFENPDWREAHIKANAGQRVKDLLKGYEFEIVGGIYFPPLLTSEYEEGAEKYLGLFDKIGSFQNQLSDYFSILEDEKGKPKSKIDAINSIKELASSMPSIHIELLTLSDVKGLDHRPRNLALDKWRSFRNGVEHLYNDYGNKSRLKKNEMFDVKFRSINLKEQYDDFKNNLERWVEQL